MNRRFRWWLLVGVAVMIGVGLSLAYVSESRRITRARFERVAKGMSWDEVIRTVGAQPGDYTRQTCATLPHGIRYMDYKSWLCDDGQLLVLFDGEGKATDVVVCDVMTFGPPPLLERCRRLLGL